MAFALSNKLKTHIREVHQKDQLEMKKCDMCDKQYVRKAELDVHIDTVHKQLKNYQCPQCGKTCQQGRRKTRCLSHKITMYQDGSVHDGNTSIAIVAHGPQNNM